MPSPLKRPPRRYPRAVLRAIAWVEAACVHVLRGKALYARALRPPRLRVAEVRVPVAGLPAGLDGLRIVHLSDFHAGPFLDAGSLAHVEALVAAARADLLCLTGDYITHRADEGVALAPSLGRMRGNARAFAVFGNHDYRERREGEMARAFAEHGIATLRNAGAVVERGGARLYVAGIEDIEEGKVIDLDAALRGRRPGDIVVLLAHHPDVADAAAARGIALVLSGHTHAGQIRVAGRSVLGGSLRSRYRHGLHRIGDAALHVTGGIGVLAVPFRRDAPAEVSVLTLVRADGEARQGVAPS